MTTAEHVAYERTRSSLNVALRFVRLALTQLPDSAQSIAHGAMLDARDSLIVAVEMVEESAK